MNPRRLTVAFLQCVACATGFVAAMATLRSSAAAAEERNIWPVVVQQIDAAGHVRSWTGAGPFLFRKPLDDGTAMSGFRPLWVQARDTQGNFHAGYFLYPLFSYTVDAETYRWSFFELINRTNLRAGAAPSSPLTSGGEFDLWPFWFSRQTGDPGMSYHALFPVAGTLKNRLGFERLSWVLFPLYVQSESRGAVTTQIPWPILRVTRGAAHGFGIWPLFNWQDRPGVSRQEYILWPLGYNNTTQPAPDAPPGTPPTREIAALPFYARTTGPGLRAETYLWPFFGYTDRKAPKQYHETRYFWPFLVQGRGDENYVNRWGPFYTHSIVKGYDKTWYLWPLVRRAQWTDAGLVQTKMQVLYFVYWSEVQRSASNPKLPPGSLRHVWPLFSAWDNGAGRRQLQAPSPLEVFFPGNEKVRQTWTPFFTLFRYDQQAPGEERASLLWNAVTWRRSAANASMECHLGPLFSIETSGPSTRVALGHGLIGWQRTPADGRWQMFWLDFAAKRAIVPVPSIL